MNRLARRLFSFLSIRPFRVRPINFLPALIYLSLLPIAAHSAQITLVWDANPDPNLSGYKLYYGSSSRNYSGVIDVGNKTSYALNVQDSSTVYFAATDYNSSGIESAQSNEVTYTPPAACAYGISAASTSLGSPSVSGTVSVTASSGCTWTAVSNSSWVIITSNSSAAGNGAVNYSVSANSATTARSGTLTIAGKVFTVNQAGVSDVSPTVTPTSKSFSSSGGTGSVSVTAPSGGSWGASGNASWVAITSGSTGSGNGAVRFSVSFNSRTSSRSTTLTIAGKLFQVTQSGRHWR